MYIGRQAYDSKPHDVYVGSLTSAARMKVLQETSDAKYIAPGYLLFVSKSTLYAQSFDAQTLRVTGEATPLASIPFPHLLLLCNRLSNRPNDALNLSSPKPKLTGSVHANLALTPEVTS